jgi:hypothetical protein
MALIGKSISNNVQYMTLHWKLLDEVHKSKIYTDLRALEEPWNSLINVESNRVHSLLPVSDSVDSFIGPSGLLLVVSPPTCSPCFSFMGAAGKKNVSN